MTTTVLAIDTTSRGLTTEITDIAVVVMNDTGTWMRGWETLVATSNNCPPDTGARTAARALLEAQHRPALRDLLPALGTIINGTCVVGHGTVHTDLAALQAACRSGGHPELAPRAIQDTRTMIGWVNPGTKNLSLAGCMASVRVPWDIPGMDDTNNFDERLAGKGPCAYEDTLLATCLRVTHLYVRCINIARSLDLEPDGTSGPGTRWDLMQAALPGYDPTAEVSEIDETEEPW